MSEPRARSTSLKDKLDGFLADWRRSRSKSKMEEAQHVDPAVPSSSSAVADAIIIDAAAVVLGGGGGLSTSSEVSHCDESIDAPRSVTNPSPTTDNHVDDAKEPQEDVVASAATQLSSPRPTPPAPPPPLSSASASPPPPSGQPEAPLSSAPRDDVLQHVALVATVPAKKATTGRESNLKLSFTEALGLLARKHGVYYAEGSIRTRSSSTTLLDGSTSGTSERQRAIREELQRWRQAPKHNAASMATLPSGLNHQNTLLSLAAASHRSSTPRGVTAARLSTLDVVRWPLLTQLNQLYVDDIAYRIASIEASSSTAVTPIPPLVESDPASMFVGDALVSSSPPCKPLHVEPDVAPPNVNDAAAAQASCALAKAAVAASAAAQQRTHLKHRLLDFFQSYDPQRLPTAEQIEQVLMSGIPEHLLFAFLQVRYGLSSGPGLFGGSGVMSPLAATHTAVVDDEESSPLGRRGVAAAEEASPDFYIDSHGGLGSSISRKEETPALDTASWPSDWLTAVLPLVPTTAEVVMDAASWNTQSSKPGLANPKTTFVPAAQRSQLFTFNGLTMELVHDAMEATVLLGKNDSADAEDRGGDDGGACCVCSRLTGYDALQRPATAVDLINVGDVVMFPWPQSLVWSEHRRRYEEHEACTASVGGTTPASSVVDDIGGRRDERRGGAAVCNPVLELNARLRAIGAPPTPSSTAPAHPTFEEKARRRRILQAAADSATDHHLTHLMATALLNSSLTWKKGDYDPSRGTHVKSGTVAHTTQQRTTHHHHGASAAVKVSHHHNGGAHRHGRVTRHDITPSLPASDQERCGAVADTVLAGAHGGAPLLFMEDHWDLDDVDVRLAQSPIEFL